MNPPTAKAYRVPMDSEAYYRSSLAYMRRFRWNYLKGYGQWGLWLIPYGFGLFVIPAQATISRGWGAGCFTYVVCAFIGGAIYCYSDVHRQLDEGRASAEPMECSVSNEGWTYAYENGVNGFYPWETMEIVFTNPDAFVVTVGDDEFTVLRKPLQEAGLEEEFVSRIASGKAEWAS